MPLDPKENLLRALRHDRPAYVPWWDEGVCRLVNYDGRPSPRVDVDDWGVDANDPAPFTGLLDGMDRARILPIGQHPMGPLDRLMALLGPERALLSLLQEAPAAQTILDGIAGYHVAIARNYLAAGVEAGWLADDYAGARGPYLNPRLWREMILPGLKRIIAVYRQAGAIVFFHTCGQAEDFVPDLLAAGVTAFNLESQVCNLPALKERYGRQIAFVGGVPSGLMLQGGRQEVRQATRSAMLTLGREGGLVLAPDQWLAYPEDNVRALSEIASGGVSNYLVADESGG